MFDQDDLPDSTTVDAATTFVDMVTGATRMVAMSEAMQLSIVAEFARVRRAEAAAEAEAANLRGAMVRITAEQAERFLADEVAAALHLSPVAGVQRVELADLLVTGAPATYAALANGLIDLTRARRIAEGIAYVSPELAAGVEAQVLPAAPHQTAGQVAAAVKRAVIAADPAAADRAYRAAHKRRAAWTRPDDDGMARLCVLGRADRISEAFQRATALAMHRMAEQARAGVPDQNRLTVDQARADSILDVLCDPELLDLAGSTDYRARSADVHVRVLLPVAALSGGSGVPAEVVGYGPVPPALAADITGLLITGTSATDADASTPDAGDSKAADATANAATAKAPDATATATATGTPSDITNPGPYPGAVTFTRWLIDPDGVVTAACGRAYRPPPSMAATVRARDVTCRFPGCQAPASKCDLDHTIAYPAGATETSNLAALCRRHHLLKTHARWKLRQRGGGALEWTSPTGHVYNTEPPRWLHPAIHREPNPPPAPEPRRDRSSEPAPF